MTLPLISAGVTALFLVIYVILDGFDLGVGILLPFQPAAASRDHMIDSITPTWDGNETWLIMAGITLFAAFPIAYGILMPALYLPLVAMLLALGLRGVSFEFRLQTKKYRQHWDLVFGLGSTVAAFMQGLILGTILQGIKTDQFRFAGSVFDAVRGFPLLCGLSLTFGYAVLGSGWLHFKANTPLQRFSARSLRIAGTVFGILFCVACLYASAAEAGVSRAWASHHFALSVLATLFVLLDGIIVGVSWRRRPLLPFILGLTVFVVGMTGIATIVYPDIIPFQISLFDAASSKASQIFVLIGVCSVVPIVIGYSAFAYWVFRGRTPAEGWGE